MKILVLGATGGTGQLVVSEALAHRHEVTALVRDRAKVADLLPRAELVEGDARDRVAVSRALEGCKAVISVLGTRKIRLVREVTVMSEATTTLVGVMKQQGVARLICVTGLGAGDSAGHGGFVYDRLIKPILLRKIYEDKDRQEAIVQKSGLEWTIVRPTVLTDRGLSGRVRAITDLAGFNGGHISRADVAEFLMAQVGSSEWLRKTPLITEKHTSR